LSPTRRATAILAQQHDSAGGRERPHRCWAIRTTGVPDVSSPMKNFAPAREIYANDGGLLVAPKNVPYISENNSGIKFSNRYSWRPTDRKRNLAVNTSSVKEFTRSFADGGDVLRHWTKQLDKPSHMIFVSTVSSVTLSWPRVEQEVASCQLKRLQHYAQWKRRKSLCSVLNPRSNFSEK